MTIFYIATAYIAGCFSPGIGRKIKSFLSAEAASVKADVSKDTQAVAKKL